MSMFTDFLILAFFTKFIWETNASGSLPWELLALALCGVPFLWGIGSRGMGKAINTDFSLSRVIREGISIAGLIIFFITIAAKGYQALYFAAFCMASMFYLWGRLARKISSIIFAVVIFIIIMTFLIRT